MERGEGNLLVAVRVRPLSVDEANESSQEVTKVVDDKVI